MGLDVSANPTLGTPGPWRQMYRWGMRHREVLRVCDPRSWASSAGRGTWATWWWRRHQGPGGILHFRANKPCHSLLLISSYAWVLEMLFLWLCERILFPPATYQVASDWDPGFHGSLTRRIAYLVMYIPSMWQLYLLQHVMILWEFTMCQVVLR